MIVMCPFFDDLDKLTNFKYTFPCVSRIGILNSMNLITIKMILFSSFTTFFIVIFYFFISFFLILVKSFTSYSPVSTSSYLLIIHLHQRICMNYVYLYMTYDFFSFSSILFLCTWCKYYELSRARTYISIDLSSFGSPEDSSYHCIRICCFQGKLYICTLCIQILFSNPVILARSNFVGIFLLS